MSSRTRGFTIIELLVVIAIIGILSSVVIASMSSARLKSRDARRLEDIRQIKIALELYYGTNNTYPNEVSNRVPAAALAPFMPSVPVDPRTGGGYWYNNLTSSSELTACTTSCQSYVLGADMEGEVPVGDVDGSGFPIFQCVDTGAGQADNRYCVMP